MRSDAHAIFLGVQRKILERTKENHAVFKRVKFHGGHRGLAASWLKRSVRGLVKINPGQVVLSKICVVF